MPPGRKKGTPKTGGRIKGKPDLAVKMSREFIHDLLSGITPTLQDDLKKLNSFQRLQIVEKLLAYVMPKKADITTEGKAITSGDVQHHITFENAANQS